MNKSDLDRLGDRLRGGISPEDLTFLDTYRRGFRNAYDSVVDRVRAELGLEASGRPAKSTPAIVDKLCRSSMRLTQMPPASGKLSTRFDPSTRGLTDDHENDL